MKTRLLYLRPGVISLQPELLALEQELLDLLHPAADVGLELGHRVVRLEVLPDVVEVLHPVGLGRVVLDEGALLPHELGHAQRGGERAQAREQLLLYLSCVGCAREFGRESI